MFLRGNNINNLYNTVYVYIYIYTWENIDGEIHQFLGTLQ